MWWCLAAARGRGMERQAEKLLPAGRMAHPPLGLRSTCTLQALPSKSLIKEMESNAPHK